VSRFSRQLTYWDDPRAGTGPEPGTEPEQRADALHGWTLDKIDNAARYSLARLRGFTARDTTDAYDAAWHAICELILTSPLAPSWQDLARAGMDAARDLAREEMRQHGYRDYGSTSAWGPGSAPKWVKYWNNPAHASSPEEIVTDRLAVAQIWPRLTPRQREALEALAAYEDHQDAARAMGITVKTFGVTIASARRRFAALWHEGTEPPASLVRGPVSGESSRVLRPCGTEAAYFRHWRRRENCAECQAAQSERRKARKAA
jgi:hypothetical protein